MNDTNDKEKLASPTVLFGDGLIVDRDAEVKGSLTVGGGLTVRGNVVIDGTLTVNGVTFPPRAAGGSDGG